MRETAMGVLPGGGRFVAVQIVVQILAGREVVKATRQGAQRDDAQIQRGEPAQAQHHGAVAVML